jgi:hypothetical protein
MPEHVRPRWADPDDVRAPVPIDRLVGDDATNAPSRLWWTAESTRNGADNGPAVKALSGPWFAASWFKWGEMARSLDVATRTISLDSMVRDTAPDAEAVRGWCGGRTRR